MIRFGAVSGAGLALDFGAFALLLQGGLSPAIANFCSATLAVTFVYFVSLSRIFSYRGDFQVSLFAAYLAYQVVAVMLASLAVGALAPHLHSAGWAKLLVLPATFSANFIFMWALARFATARLERSPQ